MSPSFSKVAPATFLAPMQDITDASFIRIFEDFGAPDFCIAEYFRIHEFYEFEPHILDALVNPPANIRVCAQFIGENETHIARAIEELKKWPQINMLDLNLGCPAPKIYRKNVGGGLLRDPKKISSITKLMRSNWSGSFSVKMRIGFEDSSNFDELLDAVLSGQPDFITIHARTVKQLYRGSPDYGAIARAVSRTKTPIIANGDISSAEKALQVVAQTSCAGVMCGRHAVRNPWLFRQISEAFAGREIFRPKLSDVRVYVDRLLQNIVASGPRMKFADSRLKKFLNFVGAGVDPRGEFLYEMRRARGIDNLMRVCDKFLAEGENAEKPFARDQYAGVCSRPNHEDLPHEFVG